MASGDWLRESGGVEGGVDADDSASDVAVVSPAPTLGDSGGDHGVGSSHIQSLEGVQHTRV